MNLLRNDAATHRYELDFMDANEQRRQVWANYAIDGNIVSILRVEAAPELRGTGAASQFMQALVEHARDKKLKLLPICGFAVAWLSKHPDAADVLAL